MNHKTDQWRKDNDSDKEKRRGAFRRLMARPFFVLSWIVASITFILLAVFVFYPQRNTLMSLLSNLRSGPKVFRTKIPEDIKIAQNIFRGKIPPIDPPLTPPTKIERMPPVEKKEAPSRPIDAPPEPSKPQRETALVPPVEPQAMIETTPPAAKAMPSQSTDTPFEESEPRQEIEPVQPAESQTEIETTPPVAKAKPSQPTDTPFEESEPRQEIEPVQPVETQTEIETTPPVAKAVPSQPTDAASEESEPHREIEPVQPAETQKKIETTPPVAKAVPSQPTDAVSEQSELRQETDHQPPAETQTKKETTLPAEEPSVSSQPIAAPSEQIELPQKVDLSQAELRPLPPKDDIIEKTQERIIHSEKWLLSQESSYYTIQLMGARKEVLLFNFVERNQLLEQNEIAFYQTTFKDKPWFQLLFGVYATKKDAQTAADNLPPKIRESSPWIRRLSAVQKTIRSKMSP